MNRQKFIDCLRDPATLTAEQLSEIEGLTKDFPYFQTARILLAKGKKELASSNAPKYISSASVYVTDRILLKKFINGKLLFIRDKNDELKKAKLAALKKKEAQKREQHTNQKTATQPGTPAKQNKPVAPAATQQPPAAKPALQKSGTNQALPPQVRPSAPSVESRPPQKTVPDRKPDTHLDDLIKEIYQDMENLKQSKAKFRELEKRLEHDDSPSPFEEQKKKQLTPEPSANHQAPVASASLADKPASPAPEQVPTQPDAAKNDEAEKIITEFIKKEPRISQVKNPQSESDEQEKDDLSENSTRFYSDIASEYLAEIYVEQGKTDRAIEIYKNLILKFPEKESYFAGLIKKLDN